MSEDDIFESLRQQMVAEIEAEVAMLERQLGCAALSQSSSMQLLRCRGMPSCLPKCSRLLISTRRCRSARQDHLATVHRRADD
jgi:hypothetical protein